MPNNSAQFSPCSLLIASPRQWWLSLVSLARMSATPQAEAHAELLQSKEFQDELKFLQRTRDSFITAFNAITFYSSRSPYLCRKTCFLPMQRTFFSLRCPMPRLCRREY